MNWEKSVTADPKPKSAIRTYRKASTGVRVREQWVNENGSRIDLDYRAAYDGKDYPISTNKADTVALTRASTHVVEGVAKKSGVIAYFFKRVVSDDGKTLTISMRNPDGSDVLKTLLIYDRVK